MRTRLQMPPSRRFPRRKEARSQSAWTHPRPNVQNWCRRGSAPSVPTGRAAANSCKHRDLQHPRLPGTLQHGGQRNAIQWLLGGRLCRLKGRIHSNQLSNRIANTHGMPISRQRLAAARRLRFVRFPIHAEMRTGEPPTTHGEVPAIGIRPGTSSSIAPTLLATLPFLLAWSTSVLMCTWDMQMW